MLVVHAASCCDVCLEQYVWEETPESSIRTPHAIACGHVFCKTCLDSIEPAHCPLCRRGYRRDHVKKLHAEPPDVMDEDIENGFLQKILMTFDDDAGIVDVIGQVDEWLANKRSDFGTALRRMKMLQDQFVQMKKQCDDDSFKITTLRAKLKHREDTMVHDNNLHMVHQENLNEHVEVLKKRVQEYEEEISSLRTQLETVPRMPEYVPGSPAYPYPHSYPYQLPPRKESLPRQVESASEDYDIPVPRRDKGKGREIIPEETKTGLLPNTLLSNPLPAPPLPADYEPDDASSALESREIQAAIEASRNDQYFRNILSPSAPGPSNAGPSGIHIYSNANSGSSSTPVANGRPPSAQYPQSASIQNPYTASSQYVIPSTAQYPQVQYPQAPSSQYTIPSIAQHPQASSVQYPQTFNTQQTNGIDIYANPSTSKPPSQSLSVAMQEARQQQSNSPPRRVRVVTGAPEEQRIVPDVPYVRQADIYRDPLGPIVEETSASDTGGSNRTKSSEERRRRRKKRESQDQLVSAQEAREHWARSASEREQILGVVGLGLIDEDSASVDPNTSATAYKDGYKKAYKEGFGYAAARAQHPTRNDTTISGTGKIQQMNPRRQVPAAAMIPQMTQARQKAQPLPSSFNRKLGRHDDNASMLSGLSTQTWGSWLSNRSTGSELFGQLQMFSRSTNDQDGGAGPWEVSANDPRAFLPPTAIPVDRNSATTVNPTQTTPSLRRSSTATGNNHPTSESRNHRPSTGSSSARPPPLSHSMTMPDISTLQVSQSSSEDRKRREERRARRRASAAPGTQASGSGVVSQTPQNTTSAYVPSIPSRRYTASQASAIEPVTFPPSSTESSILPSGNALGLNLHSEPEPTTRYPQLVAPTPIASHEMFLRSFSNDSGDRRYHY